MEGPSASQHGDIEMPTTPTIVLVHGAWADASSWTGVIQRLQAAGHDVVALPNTLRGPTADAAVIRTYLDSIDGPVVLVAHSYGGFVITNAATGAKNVKALVYVDAFIPDEGQPAVALTGTGIGPRCRRSPNPTLAFKLVPIPGAPPEIVDSYLLPSTVTESFAQDVAAEDAAVIYATQRPASFAGFARAVRSAGLEGHPGLGDHRDPGQDHRPRLPARDGRACRRQDHRGRRLARFDGLPPGCRRRRDRTGAP